jgi:hypothetical protein
MVLSVRFVATAAPRLAALALSDPTKRPRVAKSTPPEVDSPREVLAAAIGSGRLVVRSAEQPANTWDGRILLAHDAEIAVK